MAHASSKHILVLIGLLLLLAASAWLRLANLGYSDYQGDEIKALAAPAEGQSMLEFLFEQKKGPVQFLASSLLRFALPEYSNRFLTRLPFALAGIAAILVFYRMARLLYGVKIALIGALFLAVNGLLVGLARIVQYQALVMLFSALALYCFTLSLKADRWKILEMYAGMLIWALAILSHFDGIFIAPFAIYLLVVRFRQAQAGERRRLWLHLIASAGLAALLLGVYYLPYFFSVGSSVQEYWWLRISGDEPGAGIPSSIFTFNLYNPLLALPISIFLGALSLVQIRRCYPVWLWFAFPWLVLELAIGDPGTHIYTYLLPACLLLAFGVDGLETLLQKIRAGEAGRAALFALATLVILFLGGVSHLIFVDHSPEYPWQERRILAWTVGKPDESHRIWAFGFPYYRRWDEIGSYVTSAPSSSYYSTNENKSIASHFVPYPFDINQSGYYIHIYEPQSLRERLADDKVRYWTKNHKPEKVFEVDGRVVAEVYLMPEGNVEDLKSQGY
jgi:4-amino-4-deoxy-L-arabinose transferase-like glycosyltransferase